MHKSLLAIISIATALCVSVSCSPKGEKTTLCVNPLTYTDIPDNDVIRVGDDFYMISTTMYYCPGAPIMHSKDLVHWDILSYVYDCLEDDDIYNMRTGERGAYGKGQWAASLRYIDGKYIALFCSNDQQKTYVFSTDDISRSNWDRIEIDRLFHDASILCEDGKVYLVSGNGTLHITELEPDFSAVKDGGIDQVLLESPKEGYILRAEGSHIYHIGDYYYVLVIDWPAGGVRTETCYRSKELLGEYESKTILQGAFDGRGDGVAQGAIFDTPKGDWYAMMFQDHGGVGRIPTLQPVTWVDGWPILGDNTVPVKSFEVNLAPFGENRTWVCDEFASSELDRVWQWNHKPLDGFWSLTERPGYMRLTTGQLATNLSDARNTLTQRTVGPKCVSEVKMEFASMLEGDFAGISAFQSGRFELGVKVKDGGDRYMTLVSRSRAGFETVYETVYEQKIDASEAYLKINYNFDEDIATAEYSLDGSSWTAIDYDLKMRFSLDYFTGYKTALFNYATKTLGGFVDFDYFHQSVVE